MKFKTSIVAYAVGFVFMGMVSCSTGKTQLAYFPDAADLTEKVFDVAEYDIRLQPDDELFISVSSLVPEATAHYNLPVMNPGLRSNIGRTTNPQTQTFTINPAGNIDFPVIGEIHLQGLTIEEATEKIASLISRDVADPIVKVELMNFKINVLGEVANPGVRVVATRRVSVFDAIAMAGDLTPYGKRENVSLVREENGKRTVHRLNLNSKDIFESPYYYLQQNDIVYVEPNEIRQEQAKYNQNNSYKLSVISTIVSASSVIASLVIALTVR